MIVSSNGVLGDTERLRPRGRPTGSTPLRREFPVETAADSFVSYAENSLTIPGKGDRPESCGDWYPTEFCDECGELELSQSACWCRDCPKCWFKWTRESARRITVRLNGARQTEPDNYQRRAHHIVVSPPPGSIKTLCDYYQAQKKGYQLAKEHGVRGGVCIPHAYRISTDAKARWNEMHDETESGIWKWIREHDQAWDELVEWAPHFHILGLGIDLQPGKQSEDWVFKQIRSLSPHRLTESDGYDDLLGCARYLLSHCSYNPDESKQSVRWFGALSPSQFSPEQSLSEGAYSALTRKTDERIKSYSDRIETDESASNTCSKEGCDGRLLPILDAGVKLGQSDWTTQLDSATHARLQAAYRWANGDLDPPPQEVLEGSEQLVRTFLALVGG